MLFRSLNLSVYCNEMKPFESLEEAQRTAGRSEILRALLQGFGDPDACSLWPAGQAEAASRAGVYDGPQLVFTGELDASSSGLAGYKIAMLNANARHVVFRNGMHGQWPTELPTVEDTPYRMCALRLARAFVADPQRQLDTSCASPRAAASMITSRLWIRASNVDVPRGNSQLRMKPTSAASS